MLTAVINMFVLPLHYTTGNPCDLSSNLYTTVLMGIWGKNQLTYACGEISETILMQFSERMYSLKTTHSGSPSLCD